MNCSPSRAATSIETGGSPPAGTARPGVELRWYRVEAGTRVAVTLVEALDAALNQLEREPGIGSTRLGLLLQIEGLRTWRINRFPLLWLYFEHSDHLDVVRLLGERQDLASILNVEPHD